MLSTKSAFFSLLLLLSFVKAPAFAQPVNGTTDARRSCRDILERKEWRHLGDGEKKSYIDAVKCLQSRPAQNPPIPAAKTRFDEFQAYHMYIADTVHYTGEFLPWHRHFLWSYEKALRNECGYKGAQPYWDWSLDSDSGSLISASPIFNPVTGFGGDGVAGTYAGPPADPNNTSRIFATAFKGCVIDGPFANYSLSLGPGKFTTDHCLTRGINANASRYLTTEAVANITKLPTYEDVRIEIEGEPVTSDHRTHDGGHIMIGGDMSNFYSSPGDPLFYLHHANLDRIWWRWQKALPKRIFELSGYTSLTAPFVNVTLDFKLDMGSVGSTVPISDVMDILQEPSCYTYV